MTDTHASYLKDLVVKDAQAKDVQLSDLMKKVTLIVNIDCNVGEGTNTECEALQDVYMRYKDKGLEILAFPCDQFQLSLTEAPYTGEAVKDDLEKRLGVTFPIMHKVNVNGAHAHPLFIYLQTRLSGFPTDSIKWDFTKFLIVDYEPTKRYAPTTSVMAIEPEIAHALGIDLKKEDEGAHTMFQNVFEAIQAPTTQIPAPGVTAEPKSKTADQSDNLTSTSIFPEDKPQTNDSNASQEKLGEDVQQSSSESESKLSGPNQQSQDLQQRENLPAHQDQEQTLDTTNTNDSGLQDSSKEDESGDRNRDFENRDNLNPSEQQYDDIEPLQDKNQVMADIKYCQEKEVDNNLKEHGGETHESEEQYIPARNQIDNPMPDSQILSDDKEKEPLLGGVKPVSYVQDTSGTQFEQHQDESEVVKQVRIAEPPTTPSRKTRHRRKSIKHEVLAPSDLQPLDSTAERDIPQDLEKTNEPADELADQPVDPEFTVGSPAKGAKRESARRSPGANTKRAKNKHRRASKDVHLSKANLSLSQHQQQRLELAMNIDPSSTFLEDDLPTIRSDKVSSTRPTRMGKRDKYRVVVVEGADRAGPRSVTHHSSHSQSLFDRLPHMIST